MRLQFLTGKSQILKMHYKIDKHLARRMGAKRKQNQQQKLLTGMMCAVHEVYALKCINIYKYVAHQQIITSDLICFSLAFIASTQAAI